MKMNQGGDPLVDGTHQYFFRSLLQVPNSVEDRPPAKLMGSRPLQTKETHRLPHLLCAKKINDRTYRLSDGQKDTIAITGCDEFRKREKSPAKTLWEESFHHKTSSCSHSHSVSLRRLDTESLSGRFRNCRVPTDWNSAKFT